MEGGWPLYPHSYASDSGVARICQRGGGGKVKQQSYQVGEGVGGGCPPPTVGDFWNVCMKRAFFPPTLNAIITVGFVVA